MSDHSKGRGLIFALIGLSIASFVFMIVYGVHWFMQNSEELRENAPKMKEKAAKLAAGGLEGCVEGTVEVAAECGQTGLRCILEQQTIVISCFRAVESPDPAFCEDVPSQLNGFATQAWATKECERRGYAGKQGCVAFMNSAVPAFCGEQSMRQLIDKAGEPE